MTSWPSDNLYLTAPAWTILFSWNITKVSYQDHEKLVSDNQVLVNKNMILRPTRTKPLQRKTRSSKTCPKTIVVKLFRSPCVILVLTNKYTSTITSRSGCK